MGLFTIGYEGKSLDAFINVLKGNEIELLVDVRRNPVSRKPGFSKNCMKARLESEGIEYVHMPALGIETARRQSLKTNLDYESLFEWYEDEILAREGTTIERLVSFLSIYQNVALTCYESDPAMCHRSRVSKRIEHLKQGVIPVHL